MIVLWILLILITLIVILLYIPVNIYVDIHDGNLSVKIKYLFFKFGNVSKKKSKKNYSKKPNKNIGNHQNEKTDNGNTEKINREKENESNSSKQTGKNKINKLFSGSSEFSLQILLDIFKSSKKPFKRFIKSIKINDINIDFTVSNTDAYKCAVKFGKINTAVYNAISFIGYFCKLKTKSIKIKCRFNEPDSIYNISFLVKFRPSSGLSTATCFIFSFLVNNKKRKKIKKEAANAA